MKLLVILRRGLFFEIIDLMDNITSRLNVSLKINKSYHIKIFGKHQSNIGNTLAKVYNREGDA